MEDSCVLIRNVWSIVRFIEFDRMRRYPSEQAMMLTSLYKRHEIILSRWGYSSIINAITVLTMSLRTCSMTELFLRASCEAIVPGNYGIVSKYRSCGLTALAVYEYWI